MLSDSPTTVFHRFTAVLLQACIIPLLTRPALACSHPSFELNSLNFAAGTISRFRSCRTSAALGCAAYPRHCCLVYPLFAPRPSLCPGEVHAACTSWQNSHCPFMHPQQLLQHFSTAPAPWEGFSNPCFPASVQARFKHEQCDPRPQPTSGFGLTCFLVVHLVSKTRGSRAQTPLFSCLLWCNMPMAQCRCDCCWRQQQQQ